MDGGRSSLTWSNAAGTAREVLSLLADGEERILIGTTATACSSRMEKRFAKNPRLRQLKARPSDRWRALLTAHSGLEPLPESFFAGQGGCNLIVPNIDARYLFAIQSEKTNELWCGTRGNGLLRILLDPVVGPVVSELDSEQGLPSQYVFAVAIAQG